MADVTGRAGDRGQMVVIAGLTLAILFVVLALLLNTAIFTENLATRTNQAASDEVLQFQSDVEGEVARAIGRTNFNNDTFAAQNATLNETLREYNKYASRHHAVNGQSVNVSVKRTDPGARIAQYEASRNFTDREGDGNWTVVDDTADHRSFAMNVSRDTLTTQFKFNQSTFVPAFDNSTFAVEFENSSHTWRVYLVNDANTGNGNLSADVNLIQSPSGGADLGTCTDTSPRDRTRTPVNFAKNTVGDESCPPLQFTENIEGDTTIRFVNAILDGNDKGNGTYELFVSRNATRINDTNTNYTGGAGGPTAFQALYGATVEVKYQAASTNYSSTISMVPDNPYQSSLAAGTSSASGGGGGGGGGTQHDPEILTFTTSVVSGSGNNDYVHVDLDVGDQDGDLQKVELVLYNLNKTKIDNSTTLDSAVSGSNYTATAVSLRGKDGYDYEVRMTVYDQKGNKTKETKTEST